MHMRISFFIDDAGHEESAVPLPRASIPLLRRV